MMPLYKLPKPSLQYYPQNFYSHWVMKVFLFLKNISHKHKGTWVPQLLPSLLNIKTSKYFSMISCCVSKSLQILAVISRWILLHTVLTEVTHVATCSWELDQVLSLSCTLSQSGSPHSSPITCRYQVAWPFHLVAGENGRVKRRVKRERSSTQKVHNVIPIASYWLK